MPIDREVDLKQRFFDGRNFSACTVNVLRDDQSRISDVFAGRIRIEDADRLSCTTCTH